MDENDKKEDIQRKYSHYQAMKQQMSVLLQERMMLEEKSSELIMSSEAMKRVDKEDRGKSIWSPIGSGVFAKASLENTENFIVGIGAGVFVEESKENAVAILETRRMEVMNYMEQLQTEAEKLGRQAEILETELQNMTQ
ncbi:MAG: prefoldin subunit alpha [Candidatus Aenigmarchaeota archaeon]|nr:prefoldin subunit alpha [Candidatus Aenigmarchaeota archaeon]